MSISLLMSNGSIRSLKNKQNYVPNKQIHLGYELGTNLPRPSPGEVLSFFGVSPVNYSDSEIAWFPWQPIVRF